MTWAILIIVKRGLDGGVSTKIVSGYRSEEEAKAAARYLEDEGGWVRAIVFRILPKRRSDDGGGDGSRRRRRRCDMYLQFTRRKKNGKEHRYWSIVESKRSAGSKVVQRPAPYLARSTPR